MRASKEVSEAHDATIQLRRTVTALAVLCGENVEDSMGLTEAVRTLAPTKGWWPLPTFKAQIEALGVSLADLKNPDASVLSVLSRLVAAEEFQTAIAKMGTPPTDTRIWRKKVAAAPKEVKDDDIPF